MRTLQQNLMFIRMLLVGTLLLPALLVHGQKRNFNWVMASKVWLQFSADTMVSLPMADTVSLRNACISDTNAQFLLLADDFGIRNALFETVQGGSAEDSAGPSRPETIWCCPCRDILIATRSSSMNCRRMHARAWWKWTWQPIAGAER